MTREEKKQARIDRYYELADKAESNSTAAFERSQNAVCGIPLGQPILVGHYSEGRHRAALKRSHSAMNNMVAESNKAEYYRNKAKGAECNDSIYADDENAVEKLEQKIEKLTNLQEKMKAANKILRNKKFTHKEILVKVVELGFELDTAEELLIPNCFGQIGFPDFTLTNNNATIRNAKKRLESLKALKEKEDKEYHINGVRFFENYTENRFQIFFSYKPDEIVRKKLKSAGYRWSPSKGCWQCYLNRYAVNIGKEIIANSKII